MQKDIKLFRKQLAIILHESALNVLKGTPEFSQPENIKDTSKVVVWDKNDPLPTEASQTQVNSQAKTQASDIVNRPSPSLDVPKMPINKDELVSKLRNYVISIDNVDSMK